MLTVHVALFALQGCSGGDGRPAPAATTPASTVSVALSQTASVAAPSASSASPATPSVPNVVAGVAPGCDRCTCAWTTWGEVYCWGYNEFGMLGDGMTTDQHRPVRVQLPDKAIQVDSGGYYSCALLVTGEVWCWGSRARGSIPNELESGAATKPIKIRGLENVRRIDVDNSSGTTIDKNGRVIGWSTDCGGGTCRSVLGRRPELDNALEIREELSIGCLTSQAHEVSCWTSLDDRAFPVAARHPPGVPMQISRLRSVGLSYETACFAVDDGTVYCWGQGTNGYTPWSTPQRLPEFQNVRSLALYLLSICAIHEDGTVSCWGLTEHGAVGDTSTRAQLKPQVVPNLQNVKSVVLGGHACAITEDGRLFCWGRNEHGELGDGTTTSRLEPIQIVLGESD
ncbi:MAG: hypothetical protein U0271_34415 [Polyangiaceae bacterium]